MSEATRGRRGEPLLMLAALLLAWGTWRAAAWQDPFPRPLDILLDTIAEAPPSGDRRVASPSWPDPAQPRDTQRFARTLAGTPTASPRQTIMSPIATRLAVTSAPFGSRPLAAALPVISSVDGVARAETTAGVSTATAAKAPAPGSALVGRRRVSGEAWLLLRDGSARPGAAPAASYGGSQAGAIISYRLGASPAAPSAFVRTSGGLAGIDRPELALGLSARPIASVPVTAHAELRARDRRGGGVGIAPAAFVTAGHVEPDLPGRMRGEAYVQAGYVGGDFATGFVDGNARIARPIADPGGVRIAATAGLWGGAQRGAARLDAGPGLTAETTIAGAPLRVSLDYRLRVAGNAAPDSGPVLTLSTGL